MSDGLRVLAARSMIARCLHVNFQRLRHTTVFYHILLTSILKSYQSLTLDNENSILSIYNCTKGFKAWIYCHGVGNLSKAGRQRKKAPKEPRFMISST